MIDIKPDASNADIRKYIIDKDIRFEDIYRNYPVWFRIRTLGCLIDSDNSNIDWNAINNILYDNISDYDYNCFDRVNSYNDLSTIINSIILAYKDNGIWRSNICNVCGREFFISSRDIFRIEDKKYRVPRVCNYCKSKSKNKLVYSSGDNKGMTQIEAAMREAGLIK